MVTEYFPAIAKMLGTVYATKICPFLLITRLACDQLRAYFLCRNYVPIIIIMSLNCGKKFTRHIWSCLIKSVNMKWIWWALLKIQSRHDSVDRRTGGRTDRRTDKRTRWNQYTSLIIFVEADWGYDNIQIVLPLTSDPILMAKNDAH